MNSTAQSGGSSPRAGAEDPLGVNSEVGRKLQQYYNEILSEDVPDRFADLLRQLEAADTGNSEG